MKTIEDIARSKPIGSRFWVRPAALGMTPVEFDEIGREAQAAGEGDGYKLVDWRHEDQSGDRLFIRLQFERVERFDGR